MVLEPQVIEGCPVTLSEGEGRNPAPRATPAGASRTDSQAGAEIPSGGGGAASCGLSLGREVSRGTRQDPGPWGRWRCLTGALAEPMSGTSAGCAGGAAAWGEGPASSAGGPAHPHPAATSAPQLCFWPPPLEDDRATPGLRSRRGQFWATRTSLSLLPAPQEPP